MVFSVEIRREELVEYFKLIMVAIRKDRWISNLFYRLANKNIRNGIQIFEDFCKSGHMRPNDILAMRVLGDESQVPTYRFENVLLRKNRRFYNGDESNFVNLFASDYNDDFPDPFVRVDILNWLQAVRLKKGSNGDKELFPALKMEQNLQIFGHSIDVIQRELIYLIKKGLVFCENTSGLIDENDLIKLTIPGSLHLQMLSNVAYLAACAEDTLFKNTEIMMRISNRLKIHEACSKLALTLNAKDLVNYLVEYRKEYPIDSRELLSEQEIILPFDLGISLHAIEQWIQADAYISATIDKIERFKVGMHIDACIVSKSNGGLVCTIAGEEIKGFTSIMERKYLLPNAVYADANIGDIIKCQIIEYDIEHRSFQLRYVNRGEIKMS